MMNGVERLRADFDAASFDVAIVSAGYGLISEERLIAPYNITFQGKGLPWVRERGKALKLPAMTRELLSQYQVVFFLLGKEYLASLDCPLEPTPDQKCIYFGTAAERFRLGTHALTDTSQTKLWSRLSTHRGHADGRGNHRGSIFRKRVGQAILNRAAQLGEET
jgi:hypothetical protein